MTHSAMQLSLYSQTRSSALITKQAVPIHPRGVSALHHKVDRVTPPLHPPKEPTTTVASKVEFDPTAITQDDIQSFVQKVINGEPRRTYTVNPPPIGRPIRIYADGVYELFHFGHALQLRQAKLSFPSVHLLAGVHPDDFVKLYKAGSIMTHAERCEMVRHCRWVDQVIPEAPWVIDTSFLDKWEIDYVAHDEEPYTSAGTADVYALAKSLGKFIPTRRTPGVSTSDLLERIISGYRRCDFDEELARMGRAELRVEGGDLYEKKLD